MKHALRHLDEFEKLLANYHISPNTASLQGTRLVLLFGATASGSDSIIRELTHTGRFVYLISNTTRPKRINNGVAEQDGVEYWFKTEEEMLDDLRNHRMLEAEIIHNQQVSGISLAELQSAAQHGKIAVTKVEFNIKHIIQAKPDALAVLVLPPTFSDSIKRLEGRGKLPVPELRRRIETAAKVYKAGIDWDFLTYVINDTVEHAVEQIEQAIDKPQSVADRKKGKQVTSQLYNDAEAWLAAH